MLELNSFLVKRRVAILILDWKNLILNLKISRQSGKNVLTGIYLKTTISKSTPAKLKPKTIKVKTSEICLDLTILHNRNVR